ncbi:hypothetical protein EAF00_007999 [Botryotinia globosa]|nr:hypothetical protein EAF00_007999 [Botryotinia globosa]
MFLLIDLKADEDDSAIGARVVLSKLPIFRIGLLRYDAFHVSAFSARYNAMSPSLHLAVYVSHPQLAIHSGD